MDDIRIKQLEELLAEKTAECEDLRKENERLGLKLLDAEDDGRIECLRALAVLKGAQLFCGQGGTIDTEAVEHLIDVAAEILEGWENDR